jgi:hypothetical protein
VKAISPRKTRTRPEKFLIWYSRTEILLGCASLVVGGFYTRFTGNAVALYIGAALVGLGCWHLMRHVNPTRSVPDYRTDRLYVRLKERLSDGYSMAFDVPVDGERIDYLIIGSPGVFVIRGFEQRGEIEGTRTDETWRVTPPGGEEETMTVENPFVANDRAIETVRERLSDRLEVEPAIYNLVVALTQRLEGAVLDEPECLELGEVAGYIEERPLDTPLDLSQQRSIERALKLRSD